MVSPVSHILPSSYRKRRRLASVGLTAVALAVLGLVAWVLPERTPPPDRFAGEASLYVERTPLELSALDKREIGDTLEAFVRDGLGRRDPLAAYALATPQLRASASRSAWARGELPLMPFDARPGDARGYLVQFAWGNEVGVDVFLHNADPKADSIVFSANLRRVDGRWRVDAMFPAAVYGGDEAPAKSYSQADLVPGPRSLHTSEGRIAPVWLIVVPGVLVVGLAAALAAGIRAARRQ